MRKSENTKLVIVGPVAAVLIFGLFGCAGTLDGIKTDIYDTRKGISDFISPDTNEKKVSEKKVSLKKVSEKKVSK